MKKSARSSISQAEYHQLLGLKLLADRHNRALDEIDKAALAITQESEHDGTLTKPHNGHTSDMIISERTSVDELLELLGISVSPSSLNERE